MGTYFFDSSGLIKRYILEQGSQWVHTTTIPSAQNRILISRITPVEMVSAFARRHRENSLSLRQLQAVVLFMERHVSRQYGIVQFSDSVEKEAKELLSQYALRAFDAVQLASAIKAQEQLQQANLSLTFVSGDTRLLTVAQQSGLAIENPNLK